MLWKVLHAVEEANAPLDLNELSRRLDVDRSVLDGMIQFWVRKGRLADDATVAGQAAVVCATHGCRGSCPGPQGCPFTMKMPRMISVSSPAPD